jgi:nucleotide-binding universal stress UspA family protein
MCPAPVWVVKNDVPRNVTSVLAAVDLSDVSRLALEHAKWIAELAHATLHVLHVVDCPDLLSEFLHVKPAKGEYGTLRELIDAEAKRDFDEFLSENTDQTVPVQRHLCWGNSAQEIIAASQRLNVDLVTLGCVGRTGLQGVLLGNTAENVLAHCDCDVLAVKPQDFVSPIEPATWQLHPGPEQDDDEGSTYPEQRKKDDE